MYPYLRVRSIFFSLRKKRLLPAPNPRLVSEQEASTWISGRTEETRGGKRSHEEGRGQGRDGPPETLISADGLERLACARQFEEMIAFSLVLSLG